MEFHEKLQELRKNRGMTQEELAAVLYVSRTAVSKWESGRGYPSIDSLKEISKFFSVSIDDLLSGEKLLSIAEKENKSNIRNICDLLFGVVDLCSFMLILLPLYPNTVDGFVYSVNLLAYTETTPFNRAIYWFLFSPLIIIGGVKILLTKLGIEEKHKMMTGISMLLSIVMVLFLAMAREAYAIMLAFMLLVIKGVLLLKYIKCHQSFR
ncbi:MAG: helix-turn-helix transcriptional regulator [Lachnospiraceae bacterium]|nr:helix-turn-helix transcriptional regulator [Lachnospiraceae bacterium]